MGACLSLRVNWRLGGVHVCCCIARPALLIVKAGNKFDFNLIAEFYTNVGKCTKRQIMSEVRGYLLIN